MTWGRFGNESTGPDVNQIDINDVIFGGKFTCPISCTPKSMGVFAKISANPPNYKCAIYNDSLNLVAQSIETAMPPFSIDFGWRETALFTTTTLLIGGQDYYLFVWAKPGVFADMYMNWFDTPGTNNVYTKALAYGSWPDPLVGLSTTNDETAAMYCGYEPCTAWATIS